MSESNWRQQTIDTYNQSANELAAYFEGIGSRVEDIERAIALAGSPENLRALEIGCGDGRDGVEIAKRAGWYHGFDLSEGLIALAKQRGYESAFSVADAVDYEYPEGLNVVFAFASLLHLNKEEIGVVLSKVHSALIPQGIFYISLKEKPEYTPQVKEDKYGSRLFYFYNPQLIEELAGQKYQNAGIWQDKRGDTDWFEIALRKI